MGGEGVLLSALTYRRDECQGIEEGRGIGPLVCRGVRLNSRLIESGLTHRTQQRVLRIRHAIQWQHN